MKFFQCFPNLPMKFYTILDEDRIVCCFLNKNMTKRIFFKYGLNKTHFLKKLDMCIKPTIQMGQAFQDIYIKKTTNHCCVLQNMFGCFRQAVDTGTQHTT